MGCSIIVINTITINASETAVARSRESAWIPFTPLLSWPSFSGYITSGGNPLFGKFFGFARRAHPFRCSRLSRPVLSSFRRVRRRGIARCSLLFAHRQCGLVYASLAPLSRVAFCARHGRFLRLAPRARDPTSTPPAPLCRLILHE